MIVDLLYASLGLVILLLAGDSLVKGAVNLALRLGIPALIVSLTVVAFGTSAPELLISVQAVLDGVPGLALGNVVGSNTANILLVLGIPALLKGLETKNCDSKRNYVQMMAASVLFIALAFSGAYGWLQGLILLAGLAFMLISASRAAMSHRREMVAIAQAKGKDIDEAVLDEQEDLEGVDPDLPGWKIALFLALGLVGLPLGASLLVDASTNIARDIGVSETVIGLTLVAVGTSLPELATTVMAAYRRQADVAIGNVIGSNMFNLLGIIGIAALVGPIPVDPEMLRFDMWVMLASSFLLAPFVFKGWRMGRRWGLAFAALYVAYVWAVLA
ncbi:calcium/sodium antiporter [Maritimibacter dapengensis]|uniref:Calcium/sodium antiporter n=1 Tax=Maritimibacter dapengensis TaxID=2836868 RepID=A0ABS6SWL3_9RHOB|nr:calcium/sodium antiporter [Maritimibacter dapengensis]MBV7377346.1 calcium/sodium antiporter [Maritimibacter dapengensis]